MIGARHYCLTSSIVKSIHDTLNGWGWGTTSNPRCSYNLDVALIQLSLSTITLQFFSNFGERMKSDSFSPIILFSWLWGDTSNSRQMSYGVWLVQLRPTSSLVCSSSVSSSSPLKMCTSESGSVASVGVSSIMVILMRLKQLAAKCL